LVTTADTLIFTGSVFTSGSIYAIGTITGSLLGTSSWASNAISSSYALTASYAMNGGGASDWDSITNKPAGLVSSSTQINTGSFSGSFIGELIGTSSWAFNAVSASYIDGGFY
jgi:hypothetical protein